VSKPYDGLTRPQSRVLRACCRYQRRSVLDREDKSIAVLKGLGLVSQSNTGGGFIFATLKGEQLVGRNA